MSLPILQTRMVGYAPDERSLMKPMEVVYEVGGEVTTPRARPSWALKIFTLANIGGLFWLAARFVAYNAHGFHW